jgi:hypothetical protein
LNRARKDRRPFNELVQYFGMERFLYRLSRSDQYDSFVLKGALLFRAWGSPEIRPTMDIDLLGRTPNAVADVVSRIRSIVGVEVEDDGIVFDPESVQAERITENADYQGIRIRLMGSLDSARVSLQVDIGFGDVVHPGPAESELPALLDFPAPRLLCYSRESSIAEKLAAMVTLGTLNSRMKDFYDIWLLSRLFDFIGPDLAEAVRLTFERRGMELSEEVEAFGGSFADSKQEMWKAFRNKLGIDHAPGSFLDVNGVVGDFLSPVIEAISTGKEAPGKWIAPGPWI